MLTKNGINYYTTLWTSDEYSWLSPGYNNSLHFVGNSVVTISVHL